VKEGKSERSELWMTCGDRSTFVSKAKVVASNGVLLFPQHVSHGCFFQSHSSQQLLQKPQLNQTHSKSWGLARLY
jgi:hypothetical protein